MTFQVALYVIKCLIRVWNIKYNSVHCAANLLAGLAQYYVSNHWSYLIHLSHDHFCMRNTLKANNQMTVIYISRCFDSSFLFLFFPSFFLSFLFCCFAIFIASWKKVSLFVATRVFLSFAIFLTLIFGVPSLFSSVPRCFSLVPSVHLVSSTL